MGRERELGQLREALGQARAGSGRVRMICGEPGIGKSRLAEEVAAEAMQSGMHALRGRCHEGSGAPPYWPWLEAVRPLLASSTEGQAIADWGAGAQVARVLFPDLATRVAPEEPRPTRLLPDEVLWFRLLDAMTGYLLRVSRRRPLCILLDDLHWADRRSLDLLVHLTWQAARYPVLVLGTVRDTALAPDHPLAKAMGELVKEPAYAEVRLEGLDRAEVERYLELAVGDGIPSRLARSVHRLTDGNPLYLGQLARDRAALEGTGKRPPEGLHGAIASRLGALSAETREALAAASLFAGAFRVEELAAVLGRGTGVLLAAADEALRARILRAEQGEAGLYDFVHGLIRDCLRADLPLERKVELHAAIASTLERAYGQDPRVAAAELVAHFAAARPLVGPRKAAVYARDAARRALEQDAWEDCIRSCDAGLGILEGESMDDLKAELMSLRCITLNLASGLSLPYEASAELALAFEQFERSGNAPLAMELVRRVGAWLVARWGPSFRERALRFAAPGSAEAATVLYILALGHGNFRGDYTAAREAFDEALRAARDCGDLELEWWVLRFAAVVDCNHLEPESAIRTARRQLELAAELALPRLQILSRLELAAWLQPLGRGEEARAHCARALELAEALEDRHTLLGAKTCRGWQCFYEGDMEAARRRGERNLVDAPPLGWSWFEARHFLLCVACESGRFDEGRRYLEEILDWARAAKPGWQDQSRALACRSIGEAALLSGDTSELSTLRSWAVPLHLGSRQNPRATQYGLWAPAMLAWLAEDRELAAEVLEALGPLGIAPDIPRLAVARGVLARMLGRTDEAVAELEGRVAQAAWCVPFHVLCQHELASTLLLRGEWGDRARAKAAWTDALGLAERHGLEPWAKRAREGLERLEGRAARDQPGRAPDGLTAREVEVLRLLASGKTNKEIGSELAISARTVENHVARIFAKAGVVNRTEAANYAHRHGLG